MRKLLALSLLPLLLLNECKGTNSAYDVAHEACVAAMTADPIISALIPGWGQAANDVVSLICAIPAVIADFQTLTTEQAKAKTVARITSMTAVKLPAPAASTPAVADPPAAPAAPPPVASAPVAAPPPPAPAPVASAAPAAPAKKK